MTHHYQPHGVCSRKIYLELDNGLVRAVRFEGGCSGNTQGVARLVEGMPAQEAIRRLSGIRCGTRSTSCPDQLAMAIRQAIEEEAAETHS